MRRALLPVILPAALLLAGCSVFQGGSGQPAADGWEQHDGYSLQCKNVERVECLRFADDLAARHRAESDAPILSILVDPEDGWTVCWGTTAGNQCRTAIP